MLEIVAKVQDLGAISEKREQIIKLSEVAIMTGEFCISKTRHIVFLNPAESKKFIKFFRNQKPRK